MGTNFYAVYNKCSHCGREDRLHIGKRSGGWEFGFQAHDEPELKSATQYRVWLRASGAVIYDEYGETWSLPDFWEAVGETRQPGALNHCDYVKEHYICDDNTFKDAEGWSFTPGDFS